MTDIIMLYVPDKKFKKKILHLGYEQLDEHYFIKDGFNPECKLDIDSPQKMMESLDHELYDELPNNSKIYFFCSLINKFKLTLFKKVDFVWELNRKVTNEQIQKDSQYDRK